MDVSVSYAAFTPSWSAADHSIVASRGRGSVRSDISGQQEMGGATEPQADSASRMSGSQTRPLADPDRQKAADLAEIRDLQRRDQVVRQHEMAHLAASGGLALSGASYTYRRGPDGVAYAVGGEVNIDTSPGRTPQETLQRAETVVRAALAPADPSPQDRAVAAKARQMAMQASVELLSLQQTRSGVGAHQSERPDPSNTLAQSDSSKTHPGIRLYRQNAEDAPILLSMGLDVRA